VRLRITARPTVPVDREVTGWLVWRGDRHRVRVPVSVRPTVVAAPEQVEGRGDSGAVVVRGRSGNGRTLELRSTRLVAARTTAVRLVPGPADPQDDTDDDAAVTSVQVPAGTDVVRFGVDGAAGAVDLHVHRGDQRVGSSTGASPQVTLSAPARGIYRIHVHDRVSDGASPALARLSTWVVPRTNAPRRNGGAKLQLSTDAVGFVPGRTFRYSASWKGLAPEATYLAVVRYGDSDRRTVLEVDSR
jgi:hypothetical protein